MNKIRQMVTGFLLFLLVFFTAGCGVSEEKYNEAVASADDYKTKYEQASLDFEKCRKELEETKDELLGYEPYHELISDLNNKDYRAAIKKITEMSSEDAEQADSNDEMKNEDIETGYLGVWASEADNNCKVTFEANGVAYIGDMLCYWELLSSEYGPYGINLYVDGGKGRYEFLMEQKEKSGNNILKGNSMTTNMPEYLSIDGFFGKAFTKNI